MFAERMDRIEGSGVRKMFELISTMEDPINLSIGQADYDAPAEVKDAAIAAIREGQNRYTVTARIPVIAAQAHAHGIDRGCDADRAVFAYAKAKSNEPPEGWLDRRTNYDLRRTEEPIHLFEIGIDGRGLRQLTDGEWSDLDPTYLPSGDIAFVCERCAHSPLCYGMRTRQDW